MLFHVVHEVIEKLDFLLQVRREGVNRVVVLTALEVDVVNVSKNNIKKTNLREMMEKINSL